MGAVSQRPGRLDLDVVRGDDAEIELTFVNTAGDPVDLSGRTWQLRLGGAATFNLDNTVVMTRAATGVISFPLADTVTATITGRTRWWLRDATGKRTVLDGAVNAYAPGWAGKPSATATITAVTSAATVTVVIDGDGGDPYAGDMDGGAATTDYSSLTVIDGGGATTDYTGSPVINGGAAA